MRDAVPGATAVAALAAAERRPLSSPGTGAHDGGGVAANRSSPADPSVDLTAIAIDYIEAVGRKKFDRVAALLDPGVEFTTPGGRDLHGVQPYLEAIAKLAPILVRNDVKTTFVTGGEACVIYDFVTDTAAGAIPSVEWLTFKDGKIASVRLVFHSKPWPIVLEELARRTSAPREHSERDSC